MRNNELSCQSSDYFILSHDNIGNTVLTGVKDKNIIDAVIPEGVTVISKKAFYDCSLLSSVSFPKSIIKIGPAAFKGCTSLTRITIPSGVKRICEDTFKYCTSLEEITFPEDLTVISGHAFESCRNLAKINLPASLESISVCAFGGCSSLTHLLIPGRVSFIDRNPFVGCNNIEKIVVSPENTTYHSDQNCIIETDTKKLKIGCKNSIIPSNQTVTAIDCCAFAGCSGLTSINVPVGVRSIGHNAFSGCSKLTSIYIPDGVTDIDERAFYYCTGLTNVILPKGIVSISNSLFYFCTSLTSITIPEGVISIGELAFCNCSSLHDIYIPDSVCLIGNLAFSSCSHLLSITIPAKVKKIEKESFSHCYSLESLSVSSENPFLHSDGNCIINSRTKTLLLGCNNSIIPQDGSVSVICEHAFFGCSKLTDIAIPNSITSIGDEAFSGCSSLTSIFIPASVKYIGKNAFSLCGNLKKLIVSNDNQFYHSNGNCIINTKTKTLILGCDNSIIPQDGSVIAIDKNAFSSCCSLESLIIPASIIKVSRTIFTSEESCSGPCVELINESEICISAFCPIVSPKIPIIRYTQHDEKICALQGFLLYSNRFSGEIKDGYSREVIHHLDELLSFVFDFDAVQAIAFLANAGQITAKNLEPCYLIPAQEHHAPECEKWLITYRNSICK